MRKQSFAAGLLIVGLIIFGVRMERSLWPHTESSEKSTTAQTAPAVPVASLTVSASNDARKLGSPPAIIKSRKSAPVAGSHSLPVKTAVPRARPAMLEIEVDHKFAEAHLSIWVDEELTYTHPLQGIEKKRLVVFHRVQGHEFHAVQISPGKHLLRVQVSPGAGAAEQSSTVEGEFASGTEKMLQIQFSKSGEMILSLQ